MDEAKTDTPAGESKREPVIGCVVMASGKSGRYGKMKLLEDLCLKPLILRTLEPFGEPGMPRPVVVTRSEEIREVVESAGVQCLMGSGELLSDTIRTGLSMAGDCGRNDSFTGCERQHEYDECENGACGVWDGAMFLPGDQPLLTSGSVREMVRCFDGEHILRLAWENKAGSPVLFPRRTFKDLRALTGDRGGSVLISPTDGKYAHLVRLVQASCPWELLDIDTPEDMEKARRLFRSVSTSLVHL